MRSVFQLAAVASLIAFATASLPLYASMTGWHLHVFGVRISAASFGPGTLLLMLAFLLATVVCLILSLTYRERGRWVSAVILISLLALAGVAIVVFGRH